jgi:hypothetical protein
MRRKIAQQLGLVTATATTDHVRARELDVMSRVLDALPRSVDLVYRDLVNESGKPQLGRHVVTNRALCAGRRARGFPGFPLTTGSALGFRSGSPGGVSEAKG